MVLRQWALPFEERGFLPEEFPSLAGLSHQKTSCSGVNDAQQNCRLDSSLIQGEQYLSNVSKLVEKRVADILEQFLPSSRLEICLTEVDRFTGCLEEEEISVPRRALDILFCRIDKH
jgi:hypothetical protein